MGWGTFRTLCLVPDPILDQYSFFSFRLVVMPMVPHVNKTHVNNRVEVLRYPTRHQNLTCAGSPIDACSLDFDVTRHQEECVPSHSPFDIGGQYSVFGGKAF